MIAVICSFVVSMDSIKNSKNILGWVVGILIVLTTLLVMFPPNMSFLKKGAEYAVFIMLGFLLLGMLFMVLDKKKLMMVSLICTGILCLFLKSSSNNNMIFPARNNSPNVSIAHINLSYVDQGYEGLLKLLDKLEPEIISFQEMTPDWDFILKSNLSRRYQNKYALVRMDTYGMAIYSKKNFTNVDTFMYRDIPNIKSHFDMGGNPLVILSSYLLPPLDRSSTENMQNQLSLISKNVQEIEAPHFAIGDYNLVPWSNEVREFRDATKLGFSRRSIAVSKYRIPHDHIMYSKHLECIEFQELEDEKLNHIGIYGVYQLKADMGQVASEK